MPFTASLKANHLYKVSAITIVAALLYCLHISQANAFFIGDPSLDVKQALRYAIQETDQGNAQTAEIKPRPATATSEPVSHKTSPMQPDESRKPQSKPIESIVDNQTKPAPSAQANRTARLLMGQAFLQAAAGGQF